VAGVPSTTSTYDGNDRLMSASWDPNGNTVQSGANQYGYDSENRLLSLNRTAANYVYDGDGQLVQKTVPGVTTTYLIDDQTPAGYTQIAEERVSGVTTKSYVYGPQRISMRDSAGLHYYGYDAHSGVRLLMDGSGNVTDTWDYDAFGKVIARTGTTANDFTYRGEQMDSALGLQYLRVRWMDPGKGRFATRDTWEGSVGRVQSQHLYNFASGDSVNRGNPPGVLVGEVQATMALLYAEVATRADWFPLSIKPWLGSRIVSISRRLNRYPPDGIFGLQRGFESEQVGYSGTISYRIEIDNLRGTHLRQ
jgi:RHS repeat-associated protein